MSTDLPRMVMPQNVPVELRDEVPTRDGRAPPGQQQLPRPLNLAADGKPQNRLEQMLGMSQDGSGRGLAPGVIGSKDEFWQELKQISQSKKQRPQTGMVGGSNEGSSTHHGQQWINFELHGKCALILEVCYGHPFSDILMIILVKTVPD